MALMALVGASCQKAEEGKAPITKPQITIEGGRLTPEGLWAMGRIGSVKSDIETGRIFSAHPEFCRIHPFSETSCLWCIPAYQRDR